MERYIRIRFRIKVMDTRQLLCRASLHLTHAVGKGELHDINFVQRDSRYAVQAYLLSGFVQCTHFVFHDLFLTAEWYLLQLLATEYPKPNGADFIDFCHVL